MLDEGRSRIFDRGRDDWDATWRMVIYEVPEESRAERDKVRRTLAWHGFGPLAASTWISPHPRLDTVASALAAMSATRIDLLECRSRGRDVDREMAARCWDLRGLAAITWELVATYDQLPPVAQLARLAGQDALRQQVELVASYRTLPFRDPDLPPRCFQKAGRGVAPTSCSAPPTTPCTARPMRSCATSWPGTASLTDQKLASACCRSAYLPSQLAQPRLPASFDMCHNYNGQRKNVMLSGKGHDMRIAIVGRADLAASADGANA
jgi:hypothetical protein